MIANPELHRIRTGEATSHEARTVIRELLRKDGGKASAALYTALRAWTWKALQTRRFDDEMPQWFQLLQATGSALSRHDAVTSHYVEALGHLVDESVRYAESHAREKLIRRSHLGEILEIVRQNNGRIERERLSRETNLAGSRLSQLLGELVIAGALEREKLEDRRAAFVLTDAGRELLDLWRQSRKPAPPPESPKVSFNPGAVVYREPVQWRGGLDAHDGDHLNLRMFKTYRGKPERPEAPLLPAKQITEVPAILPKIVFEDQNADERFDLTSYGSPRTLREVEHA